MSVKLMAKAWDMDIPPSPKMVLLALCDHSNDEGRCYPGQENLAKKCSASVRSIRNSLDWLEKQNLIQIARRQKGRNRLSDEYQITLQNYLSEPEKSPNQEPANSVPANSAASHEPANSVIKNRQILHDEPATVAGTLYEEPSDKNRKKYEPSDYAPADADASPPAASPPPSPAKPKKPDSRSQELALLQSHGVPTQLANDFLTLRKAKRQPLTVTAMQRLCEAGKGFGMTPEQTVLFAVEHGWASATPEYIRNALAKSGSLKAPVASIKTIPRHTQGGAFLAKDIL